MFPLFRSKAALNTYQTVFCRGRFETCARRRLAMSGTTPPPDLLPDGALLPKHWLSEAGASDA